MNAIASTPSLSPDVPAPPTPAPREIGDAAGWTDLVRETAAMFASAVPPSRGDVAKVEDRVAAMVSAARGDTADQGAVAAAETAAQATMGAPPSAAKGATPKQAADQAGQWIQAYIATYDAWLAVLTRRHAPAPPPPAARCGVGITSPVPGSGPAPAPSTGASCGGHHSRPAGPNGGSKDASVRTSLLAHALTLWTQNVTATFSALPAYVPPQQAHGDPDAAQRLLELARRAMRHPSAPSHRRRDRHLIGRDAAGGCTRVGCGAAPPRRCSVAGCGNANPARHGRMEPRSLSIAFYRVGETTADGPGEPGAAGGANPR